MATTRQTRASQMFFVINCQHLPTSLTNAHSGTPFIWLNCHTFSRLKLKDQCGTDPSSTKKNGHHWASKYAAYALFLASHCTASTSKHVLAPTFPSLKRRPQDQLCATTEPQEVDPSRSLATNPGTYQLHLKAEHLFDSLRTLHQIHQILEVLFGLLVFPQQNLLEPWCIPSDGLCASGGAIPAPGSSTLSDDWIQLANRMNRQHKAPQMNLPTN